MKFCGIDYGSKLAGTTALAYFNELQNGVNIEIIKKNKDADAWLLQKLKELKPNFIFLDAPLSLPKVYQNTEDEGDYFFRKADKLLGAMSPMFLGGLTARAMRLKYLLSKENIKVYETYPAIQAKKLGLKKLGYKKKVGNIQPVLEKILEKYPNFKPEQKIKNWHEIDAILALISAFRFYINEAEQYGEENEGIIWI